MVSNVAGNVKNCTRVFNQKVFAEIYNILTMIRTSNAVVSGGKAVESSVCRESWISQHDAFIHSFIHPTKVNAAVHGTHGDTPQNPSSVCVCIFRELHLQPQM